MKKIWLILLPLFLSGCFSVFKSSPIVKHPDAPMLIIEGEGKVRVAIYYKQDNKMIEYGVINIKDLVGFSMRKYDWEAFIKKRSEGK